MASGTPCSNFVSGTRHEDLTFFLATGDRIILGEGHAWRSLAHAHRNMRHCANYADSSSDGRLLGLDTGGFHKSRRNYALALDGHELGVRHAHWLAPVISDPLAQIRPGEHAPDVIRKLVNYAGRSVSRRPIPYQIGKSNLAALASDVMGTSGSKIERRAVLTPSATSVPSRMWGRAREIGAKQ